MKLNLLLEPDPDGGFVVSVPGLRGCWSQGDTREEAVANGREAVELWLESQAELVNATKTPEAEFATLEV